jgi:hypothetical protein
MSSAWWNNHILAYIICNLWWKINPSYASTFTSSTLQVHTGMITCFEQRSDGRIDTKTDYGPGILFWWCSQSLHFGTRWTWVGSIATLRFTSRARDCYTHCVGGYVGPGRLESYGEEKKLNLHQDYNPSLMYSFKYSQQDATLYNILYYCQCSKCFRRFLHPSSAAQKLYTQHRVYANLACCYC